MIADPLHVIAGTSDDLFHDDITYQYTWPLKVCQRLLENEEAAVLNVSPAFTTSYNGVQFTWALRLSDECVFTSSERSRHVFVLLYFKEGPCTDVTVKEVRCSINDATTGEELFKDLVLSEKEFTKGSGWSINVDKSKQEEFTQFIQRRIDTNLNIVVNIKMNSSLFVPLTYLPDVETSQRIEKHCYQFIEDVKAKNVRIPDMDLLDTKDDKFWMHRMVFLFGCDLVERSLSKDEKENDQNFINLVRSTFARVYFKSILLKDVVVFDDLVGLLEGVSDAHIPPLRRELERFICTQVLASPDTEFTKKMVLLAEKYSLEVLKMVATGVLVDQIVSHDNPPAQFVSITHELKHLSHSLISNNSDCDSCTSGDALVGSVVEDLQSLTRRVRRVSLSHSPSVSSQGSSPSVTPSDVDSLSPAVTNESRPFAEASHSRFKRVELV